MPAMAFPGDRMDPKLAAEADALLTEIATRNVSSPDGLITHRYAGTLLWGQPLEPAGNKNRPKLCD